MTGGLAWLNTFPEDPLDLEDRLGLTLRGVRRPRDRLGGDAFEVRALVGDDPVVQTLRPALAFDNMRPGAPFVRTLSWLPIAES